MQTPSPEQKQIDLDDVACLVGYQQIHLAMLQAENAQLKAKLTALEERRKPEEGKE